jgi:hypothetical protein
MFAGNTECSAFFDILACNYCMARRLPSRLWAKQCLPADAAILETTVARMKIQSPTFSQTRRRSFLAMRRNRTSQRIRSSSTFIATVFMMLLLSGCGEKPPQLDTSTATNPIDQPGVCEHCNKKIEKVTEQNLITVRGNQYIICDKKCKADLKAWLAKQ